MIPNNLRVATIDNNLGGERIEMGFHKDAITHLMGLLTDLYTDQELACIREYSTNAWDAHLDAGQTRPIEVTTPTLMNPYLRIKDYGVGMLADTIRQIYSQYGASTKRDQTVTNGSMGIGAKSALTLTNQFSVVAVKDGIKTHVSVSRDSNGAAFMEIVDESVTTDPNGVEIVIPTSSDNMRYKAEKFFRYWEKGTVLLNGIDPSKRDELEKITDRIYFDPNVSGDTIFMGNVPYPTKKFNCLRSQFSGGYVAFVTMNGDDEVVFVPSREALMYNDKTNETIAGIEEDLNEHVMTSLRAKVDAASTKHEAFKVRQGLMSSYHFSKAQFDSITYKGETMPPANFPIVWDRGALVSWQTANSGMMWHSGRARYSVENHASANLGNISWIIVNYPKNTIPYNHKEKIRKYIREQRNATVGNVLLPVGNDGAGLEFRDWMGDIILDWNDIKEIRLDPSSGGYHGGGRPATNGGYHVVNVNNMTKEIRHDIKTDDLVVLYSPKSRPSTESLRFIKRYLPDAVVVDEPVNRHDKMKRLYKNVVTPHKAQEMAKDALEKSLTDEDHKVYANLEVREPEWFWENIGSMLDKIDDAEFVEFVKMGADKVINQRVQDANRWGVKCKAQPVDTKPFWKRYPLLATLRDEMRYSRVSHTVKSELVEYINYKFAKENS